MITVYCLKDVGGKIIYVGSTNNMYKRMTQHRSNKDGVRKRHGVEHFTCETLEILSDDKFRYEIESAYHLFFKATGSPILGVLNGKWYPQSVRDKIALPQIGRKKPTEQIAKMTATRRIQCKVGKERDRLVGYNKSRMSKIIDQNGVVYESMRECSRVTGCHRISINKVLLGKFKQTKGYVFRRANV